MQYWALWCPRSSAMLVTRSLLYRYMPLKTSKCGITDSFLHEVHGSLMSFERCQTKTHWKKLIFWKIVASERFCQLILKNFRHKFTSSLKLIRHLFRGRDTWNRTRNEILPTHCQMKTITFQVNLHYLCSSTYLSTIKIQSNVMLKLDGGWFKFWQLFSARSYFC